jgi:FkbM family methyltransferase
MLLSNRVGKSGKVIACDAILSNIESIKPGLKYDNVLFYCAAITSYEIAKKNKRIEFHYFPNLDGWSGIQRRPDAKDEEECIIVDVPTITLDEIIKNLKLSKNINISFMKIDVEGGDFDVLLGAKYILKTYKPVVVFEFHSKQSPIWYKYTKDNFFNYFKELGYRIFQFSGGSYSEIDFEKGQAYFELWLVHIDSKHFNFFVNTYSDFSLSFLIQKNQDMTDL